LKKFDYIDVIQHVLYIGLVQQQIKQSFSQTFPRIN